MNEEKIFEILVELKDGLGELKASHDVHAAVTHEKLGNYNASLQEHMKRTELLEAKQDKFEAITTKQLEAALLPIKAAKLLSAVAAGALSIWAFLQIVVKKP